jgi:transposase-like protein
MKKRKSYSKELKARVALDAIKGQKTVGELATEYAIHTNQISQWKRNLLDGASELFARGRDRGDEAHEAEKDRLYQQIGKLQVEVEWLKKKVGYRL